MTNFQPLDETQKHWYETHPEDVRRTGAASSVLAKDLLGDPFAGLPLTRGSDVEIDGQLYPAWTGVVANPFLIESQDGSITFMRPPADKGEENLYWRIKANCFMGLYRGNNAEQHYIHGENGTDKGWYKTLDGGVTPADFIRHLQGIDPSLLSVPILKSGNCFFMDGDVDYHRETDTPVDYVTVAKRISELRLPLVLTRSRRDGGGHLSAFFLGEGGFPASTARELMAEFLRLLGLTGEIFPKQSDKPEKLGSGVNLPYFGNSRTAFGRDGESLDLMGFLALAAKRRSFGELLAAKFLTVGTSGPSASSPKDEKDKPLPLFVIRRIHAKYIKELAVTAPGGRNDFLNKVAFFAGRAFAGKALEESEPVLRAAIKKAATASGMSQSEIDATEPSGWDSGVLKPLKIADSPEAQAEAEVQLNLWFKKEIELTRDEAFEYLALLDPEEYEFGGWAKKCADKLSTKKTREIDAAVVRRRPKRGNTSTGSNVIVTETEAWGSEVNGLAIMAQVASFFRRFVVFRNSFDAEVITLWNALTHCYQVFNVFPRAGIFAAKHDCGKSTLLDVCKEVARRVIGSDSITAASAFRLVEAEHPTLALDELDGFLRKDPELFSILKSGHKKGGKATRTEKVNDRQVVMQYDTYCPVIYGMIAPSYPDAALMSRTIQFRLEPKQPGEIVQDFNLEEYPELANEVLTMRRKLARWALDHSEELRTATPDMKTLNNRMRDNWRPIFKAAAILGGGWPDAVLVGAGVPPVRTKESDAIRLLEDIRGLFEGLKPKFVEVIPSNDLCSKLASIRESGWYRFRNNRDPIDEGDVADLLGVFDIRPKTIRFNDHHKRALETSRDTAKGYKAEWFVTAFAKYLKPLEKDEIEDLAVQVEMRL